MLTTEEARERLAAIPNLTISRDDPLNGAVGRRDDAAIPAGIFGVHRHQRESRPCLPLLGEQTAERRQNWTPGAVWVSADLGRKPGEKINLIINDHLGSYSVRGVLRDKSTRGGSVVLMDIALAMLQLGRRGRLDRILIKVPERPGLARAGRAHRAPTPGPRQARPR